MAAFVAPPHVPSADPTPPPFPPAADDGCISPEPDANNPPTNWEATVSMFHQQREHDAETVRRLSKETEMIQVAQTPTMIADGANGVIVDMRTELARRREVGARLDDLREELWEFTGAIVKAQSSFEIREHPGVDQLLYDLSMKASGLKFKLREAVEVNRGYELEESRKRRGDGDGFGGETKRWRGDGGV